MSERKETSTVGEFSPTDTNLNESNSLIALQQFGEGSSADQVLRDRGLTSDQVDLEKLSREVANPAFFYAAPECKTQPEADLGVTFAGDWSTPHTGVSRAVRGYLRALRAAGIPFRVTHGHVDDATLEFTNPGALLDVHGARELRIKRPFAHIVFTVGGKALERSLYPHNHASPYFDEVDRQARARTIVIMPFERDRLSEREVELLNECAQVWGVCYSNVRALERSGVRPDKIHLMPHSVDMSSPLVRLHKGATTTTDSTYWFYSIGKWEPRKDQATLIRAFLREFRPGEPVGLMVRFPAFWNVPGSKYPVSLSACLSKFLPSTANIHEWTRADVEKHIVAPDHELSEATLLAIHSRCHCFVTASHGEAWDFPAFDAHCIGNRVVHLCGSGHEMYLSTRERLSLENKLAACDPEYGWGDARWETLDTLEEDLGDAMREAFTNKQLSPGRFDLNTLSDGAVGKRMLGCMADMYPEPYKTELLNAFGGVDQRESETSP